MDPNDGSVNTFATEIENDEGNVGGLTLTYVGGSEICVSDPAKTYSLTVDIQCDAGTDGLDLISAGGDSCNIELSYKGKSGCPKFSMSKFWAFMQKYYFLWGAALILVGIFLAFFGNKFVNAVIYLVATIAVTIIGGLIFFNLLMSKVKAQWAQWLIIAIIFVLANFVGFLLVKFRKYGVGALAGWGGVMLGLLITSATMIGSGAAYWGIVVGMGVAFAIMALLVEKKVIMFVTSFSGSYFLIRGISLYAGGFPNESELHTEIQSGAIDWETFDKAFYGYMAGIVVLTVLSLWYQVKHNVDKNPGRF